MLTFTLDKFTFHIAEDCRYTPEGLWVKPEGNAFKMGISDFTQQRSGDVAFIEVKPAGSKVQKNEDLVVIETIKVDVTFGSPADGSVKTVNPELVQSPEKVNQSPYNAGWIVLFDVRDPTFTFDELLSPQAYFELAKKQAEAEEKA
jgi:glycine cleavage system H protein